MRSEEEAKAPLEAYYAAPKHKFEKLLDTIDWSLSDMICSGVWCLSTISQISFGLIGDFWIKHNQTIDGIVVICTWLALITHTWLHRRKKAWYDLPPTWFALTPTWRKRVNLFYLIIFGLASILLPIIWMMDYVFYPSSFDF